MTVGSGLWTTKDVIEELVIVRELNHWTLSQMCAKIHGSTGGDITVRHLSKILLGSRSPSDAVIEYLGLERAETYYRPKTGTGGKR